MDRKTYYLAKEAVDTLRDTERARVALLVKSAHTYAQLHAQTLHRLNEALVEYDWVSTGTRVGPRLGDGDSAVDLRGLPVECPLSKVRDYPA